MIYSLTPSLQTYAWGGTHYIAQLLKQPTTNQPKAELWYGDHPQAPATLHTPQGDYPLNQWLKNNPQALSKASRQHFGNRLPYLLKILDVARPLSIQLHPNKTQAQQGYIKEQQQNLPDTKRNYPDNNHKPESMIALSDFWLLHGFAPLSQIQQTLHTRPSLHSIAQSLTQYGLATTYQNILYADQSTLAQWLYPLLDQPPLQQRSTNPDYWLHHTLNTMNIDPDHLDAGLLCFYLFNIVQLNPEQGIYQRAQLPHAYLSGQNVEIMAASNNVLRAGLTPKHIDIDELLRILDPHPHHPPTFSLPPTTTKPPHTTTQPH
ncbi:mannose-6-phosphate isomerase, class I [Rappaport israeli]|uniref:mannose-6-phosphate isomerase, class I n=1 Tax=Rappaport israeli TaxID=1839807 RepID=UPI000ADA4EEB|nr:mannose-6-phosphate isomerase, class I [Rappaport israeli]